jgi:N-acetylglucosaminyl-diphospho-decaprenol L-rhamnosyltransferase
MTIEPLDVVIPVRDGWALTERCLQLLDAQTLPHAVLVVDNGSTDGTPARLRSGFPDTRVLELDRNTGFSAACNRGVDAGSGEVVVLLNNDVECRPDFLERLVVPLSEDESVGSVAPLLLRPGGEHIDSFGLTVDATLAGYPRLRGLPLDRTQATTPLLVGPTGAAAAYRRSAWRQVGGLDEGVQAYGEDVDLALRLRAAGWATSAAPKAVAVHLGSASAVTRSAWQRYQGGFSRGYFLRRYGVVRGRAALRALVTETIAAGGDAVVYSHDLAALRGRIAGWRAAAGRPRLPSPPRDAIDEGITFAHSLRLRRHVYE